MIGEHNRRASIAWAWRSIYDPGVHAMRTDGGLMATKGVKGVAKKRGRPAGNSRASDAPRRIILLATPEYDDWLEARADELRTTKSGAIDRMLAEWAKANDTAPPPRRI